jgi:hypothetical protein
LALSAGVTKPRAIVARGTTIQENDMRLVVIAAVLAGFTTAAAAQTAPAPAPAPSAAPPAASNVPAPSTPPADCRGQAQSKGLRGQAARDAIQVCVEEQRLACVKEAVEKKIVGQQRREFVRACAGRPKRGEGSNRG